MREILDQIPYRPYFCNLQITTACNLRCFHCGYSAGKRRLNELTLEEFFYIIEQLKELDCERIEITGGEPLLRKDWYKIAKHASSLGIEVNLLSNGYLIDNEVAQKIRESGITVVGISLDGLEETHNKIRQNPFVFQKAVRALNILAKNKIDTCVITTVTKLSINELPEMYKLLKYLDVKMWVLHLATPVGRMQENSQYIPHPSQIREIAEFIISTRSDRNLKVIAGDSIGYYAEFEKELRDFGQDDIPYFTGCYAGCLAIGIESNGNVKGCLALPDEFVEGNLRERSLKDIWFDKNAFSYNRKFSKDCLKGMCKKCPFGEICRAGCKALAYGATGNPFDNPYCIYRWEVLEKRVTR